MRDSEPLCSGEEQNVGVWQRGDASSSAEGPPCCGETLQGGHWRAPSCAGGLRDIGARACTCVGLKADSYTWRPLRCRLLPWNASRFCERLSAKRLLLMGDSTMAQHHATLVNAILWGGRGAQAANASGCAAQVVYAPSDTLTMGGFGRLNRGFPIRKVLDPAGGWRPGFDAAIIGTGAHITNDSDYETVLRYVTRTLPKQFPRVRLIWKTLNPAGCAAEARPLLDLPDDAFWSAQANAFNWRSFARRDRLARRAFSKAASVTTPQLGGLLDTTPMNLRADAHPSSIGALGEPRHGRDCLHLCHSPGGGPLGLGPQLLLHQWETGQLTV